MEFETVHNHAQAANFLYFRRGGGGGVHLEINSPTPGRHYMGAHAPQWKHNTTQMCAKYPGGEGGGGGWATLKLMIDRQLPSSHETAHKLYTNIEQDNESVLVSL